MTGHVWRCLQAYIVLSKYSFVNDEFGQEIEVGG